MTLRLRKNRSCCLCDRIDALERQRKKREDPVTKKKLNIYQAEYQKKRRKAIGRPSRSKFGKPYEPRPDSETLAMRRSIALAGRIPSVAKLVYDQQYEYWNTHPNEYAAYKSLRSKLYGRWKYMTDPSYRIYHRAKSKARKVVQRGGTPSHLTASRLWRHWAVFEYSCAYCGAVGDLQIEHVVPISKGGQHHLSNIVPACQSCNSNKRDKDAYQWFKSKPFYCESRWQKIKEVLAKAQQKEHQLHLSFPKEHLAFNNQEPFGAPQPRGN